MIDEHTEAMEISERLKKTMGDAVEDNEKIRIMISQLEGMRQAERSSKGPVETHLKDVQTLSFLEALSKNIQRSEKLSESSESYLYEKDSTQIQSDINKVSSYCESFSENSGVYQEAHCLREKLFS